MTAATGLTRFSVQLLLRPHPHWHCHALLMNATYDAVEDRREANAEIQSGSHFGRTDRPTDIDHVFIPRVVNVFKIACPFRALCHLSTAFEKTRPAPILEIQFSRLLLLLKEFLDDENLLCHRLLPAPNQSVIA